eukprot:Nk52_evm18s684 gene=Nk52_evmTU18s684
MSTLSLVFGVVIWYSTSALFQSFAKEAMFEFQNPFLVTTIQHGMCALVSLPFFAWEILSSTTANISIGRALFSRVSAISAAVFSPCNIFISFLFTLGNLLTNIALCGQELWLVNVVKATEPLCAALLVWVTKRSCGTRREIMCLFIVVLGVTMSFYKSSSIFSKGDNTDSYLLMQICIAFGANLFLQGRNLAVKVLTENSNLAMKRTNEDSKAFFKGHVEDKRPLFHSIHTIQSQTEDSYTGIRTFFLTSTPCLIISYFFQIILNHFPRDAVSQSYETLPEHILSDHPHVAPHVLCGFLFLCYQLASFYVLAHVSSLSHSLLNCGKRVFLILTSAIVIKSSLTTSASAGVCVTLFGLLCYTGDKARERRTSIRGRSTSSNGRTLMRLLLIPIFLYIIFLPSLNKFQCSSTATKEDMHLASSENVVEVDTEVAFSSYVPKDFSSLTSELSRRGLRLRGQKYWSSDMGEFFLPKRIAVKKEPTMDSTVSGGHVCLRMFSNTKNLGDHFNDILIPLISGLEPRKVLGATDITHDADCKRGPILYATGSILQLSSSPGAVFVWGSGYISNNITVHFDSMKDVHVKAVRGPLSCSILFPNHTKCPVILGDPGLLASSLYQPFKQPKVYKLCVIPHYIHHKHPLMKHISVSQTHDMKLMDITWPAFQFFNTLVQCEFVLSSSLHGIIFADSYGIPNAHLYIDGEVIGDNFKFKDYFGGVERQYGDGISVLNLSDALESFPLSHVMKTMFQESADLMVQYEAPIVDLQQLWDAAPFHWNDVSRITEKQYLEQARFFANHLSKHPHTLLTGLKQRLNQQPHLRMNARRSKEKKVSEVRRSAMWRHQQRLDYLYRAKRITAKVHRDLTLKLWKGQHQAVLQRL